MENIFQVIDQKKPHPLPFPKRIFYVHDTFLLSFVRVLPLLGFAFFLICFPGVGLGGDSF